MQEAQPRRKPRIPLSPEELYYFKKSKQLKELKQLEDFQKTSFYKIINRINIALAAFLTYCLFSILISCHWQKTTILNTKCSYDQYDVKTQQLSIDEIEITTTSGELIPIRTSNLFQVPQKNEILYIGRDFIFNKIIKVKFAYDNRAFWHFYTYPTCTVCVFALCMGFFIYKINRHLNVNGLLTVFGLFILASLYFVLL